MRRSELIRRIESVAAFDHPRADLEQVATPAEAAADLLDTAVRITGLDGVSVTDLGTGTGRLAIGAAWLGAGPVEGVEVDPVALELARRNGRALDPPVRWQLSDIAAWDGRPDVVIMNPPFGAQRRHADRPFWDAALRGARRAVYAFALSDSRTFIAGRAVARGARIIETHPVAWSLGRTFPHHTHARVPLSVDLWAIATGTEP